MKIFNVKPISTRNDGNVPKVTVNYDYNNGNCSCDCPCSVEQAPSEVEVWSYPSDSKGNVTAVFVLNGQFVYMDSVSKAAVLMFVEQHFFVQPITLEIGETVYVPEKVHPNNFGTSFAYYSTEVTIFNHPEYSRLYFTERDGNTYCGFPERKPNPNHLRPFAKGLLGEGDLMKMAQAMRKERVSKEGAK